MIKKDRILGAYLNNPTGDLPDTDFVVEQTTNMVKICRYKYIRKFTVNDLNPNNKP